ncbi:MAG: glycosyltransferase family 2 protein [Planctomycetes bacterium]|nr:glycosyltransferase family 2 protein [Planctomycetota bacterium]
MRKKPPTASALVEGFSYFGALLQALDGQQTRDFFEYAIVVVDNDRHESGRPIVESEAKRSKTSILYFVEPEQNIAMARNKAVANFRDDFVALIDDCYATSQVSPS